MTKTELLWKALGYPSNKYEKSTITSDCVCASCCKELKVGSTSVHITQVIGDTMANQSQFLRYGRHICFACANMYSDSKAMHRGFIVAGETVFFPMISWDSATVERPNWLEALKIINAIDDKNTPCWSVMTTDPKPRLFPNAMLTSVGNFGAYVHAPDYDVSRFVMLSIPTVISTADSIIELLKLGFIKKTISESLVLDSKMVKKIGFKEVFRLEQNLKEFRKKPEFFPALIAAGVKKEVKNES